MLSTPNQHINAYEGSRDTEDRSNDTENVALFTGINKNVLYIQIEKVAYNL